MYDFPGPRYVNRETADCQLVQNSKLTVLNTRTIGEMMPYSAILPFIIPTQPFRKTNIQVAVIQSQSQKNRRRLLLTIALYNTLFPKLDLSKGP